MPKESFIIYTSFYKPISCLSDKQLGRLFRTIFNYNLGEIVNVEEDIRMAFEFFKNQFEIDESKYQAKIKRDVENGRKGGNPNFKRGQTNPYYIRKGEDKQGLKKITQDNPGLCKITQDKAINDNDNVINISFPKVKDTSVSGETDGGPQEHSRDEIDFDKLLQFFNSQVEMANAAIAKISRITAERRRLVNCRCREYGKEAIETVIRNAVTSDFLNGATTDFVADFNWLFKPRNFLKTLEGAYNTKPKHGNNQTNNQAGRWSGRNGVWHKGAADFDCGLVLPEDS